MSSRTQTKRKLARRLRRKRTLRRKIYGTGEKPRLTVFRSHKNISCQLIDDRRGLTLASASTLSKDFRGQVEGSTGSCAAAAVIGRTIAERGLALGVSTAAFDRNGYRFHGRVKALAEAAREAGLKI